MSVRALVAVAAAAFVAAPAHAEDAGKWSFAFTPYAWLMGASGTVSATGQTVDVNAGIVDMFGKTDTLVALMANMEARHDKWAFGLDFIFTQMTATPAFATQRNPVPWLNFSASAGANVKSTLVIVEGTAGYELTKLAPATTLEGLAGVRYWHAVTDMTFGFTATGSIQTPQDVGLFSRSAGVAGASTGNMDWADPIVGLRLRHELAAHHHLQVRGDVGGFGIGSQFTWQAFAGYSYDFSPGPTSWAATVGYRALGVNYGTGANSLNLVLHGPMLGLTVRW